MRGNQKNINYKPIWTPKFAYALGLLTTDGNLSNDGRHLEFTSKDIQLLKIFKKCLRLKNKIGYKTNGFSNKKYPRIQFSNVILYKWLLRIGLAPGKSKTLKKLKIPNKYFFDFLRGCFDGDGSCYSYWDPRWASSFMFYISFSSRSLEYINWLRGKIKRILQVKGHITQYENRGGWQLKYAKNEAKRVISKMYYKKSLPCSNRKYKKLTRILEIDKNESLSN